MRILFAGSSQISVQSLEILHTHLPIVGVLTQPDQRQGRGHKMQANPVKIKAQELGIAQIWEDLSDQTIAEIAQAADVAAVVSYGRLLKPAVLEALPQGWINLHFSLLPKYRGATPVQTAILNGETETGVTVFQIDAGMDTGPIYAQQKMPIPDHINSGELFTLLSTIGSQLLADVLFQIATGQAVAREQLGDPTYTQKITNADAEINWNQPATNIFNQIRAFTPEPGAFTFLPDGTRLVVTSATIANTTTTAPSTSSLSAGSFHFTKHQVFVTTSDGTIELLQVKPQSKRVMPASDWARGLNKRLATSIV
ncbi:MAG: methionyl-tRNA formyltransferase [Bifidobacteriaceae bacterium]|jgi:methionyl-tRNA formyltransferase|nr:methionyl-tRNA formyltransferase [Bifidobacteriaceae bacterium]